MKEIFVVYKLKEVYRLGEFQGTDFYILKAFEIEKDAKEMAKGKWATYYKRTELIEKKKEL